MLSLALKIRRPNAEYIPEIPPEDRDEVIALKEK
jgi:hypothetical protein